jgi:hypothetical protein
MGQLRAVTVIPERKPSFAAYPRYINTVSSGTGRVIVLFLNPTGSGKKFTIGRCNFTPLSNGVATAGRNIQLAIGTYTSENLANLNTDYALATPAPLVRDTDVSVARLWLPKTSTIIVPASLLNGLTQSVADQLTYSGGRTQQKKLSMMTTSFGKISVNPGGYLSIICSTGWLSAQMVGCLVWEEE